ncbi:hemoglobin subunit alpha-3-like [Rana temporaria]|uniref:hemoglobin subunit alpha-3-like n=1 Tax=Rana temporaria TaxID=8407 RepID=UPI001AAE0DD4|nr:hemoglobin subunit alpha-3-like [Rana temporaria]
MRLLFVCVFGLLPSITMSLSAKETVAVLSLMGEISRNAEDLGAEALTRLFLSFPQTKLYFQHLDLTPGSNDLKKQGAKVMNALKNAADHLNNLADNLSSLADQHAYQLRVDPGNYSLLSMAIQITLATHFPAKFTPDVQAAWGKFLAEVGAVFTSRYK